MPHLVEGLFQRAAKTFADFVSQEKPIARVRAILGLSTFDRGSFLLTGPSGSGKTSLAYVVANALAAC